MKAFLTLFSIFLIPLSALTPPPPKKGKPTSFSDSGSSSNFVAGSYNFIFKKPSSWSFGSIKTDPSGNAHFILYPQEGGFGCEYTITSYQSDEALHEAFLSKKDYFKASLSPFPGGFEVSLHKAFYRCQISDLQLIEVWYSLPKKKFNSKTNWDSIKDCLVITKGESFHQETPAPISEPKPADTITEEEPVAIATEESSKDVVAPTELTAVKWEDIGYVFKNQEENTTVLFEANPHFTLSLNDTNHLNYRLKIKDNDAVGYLYFKWNVQDTSDENQYKDLMGKMLADLKKIDTSQRFYTTVYRGSKKQAYMIGYPYTLQIFGEANFLMGFLYKSNLPNFDLNGWKKQIHYKHD